MGPVARRFYWLEGSPKDSSLKIKIKNKNMNDDVFSFQHLVVFLLFAHNYGMDLQF